MKFSLSAIAMTIAAVAFSSSAVFAAETAKDNTTAAPAFKVMTPVSGGVANKVYTENYPELKVATYNMGAARISNIDEVTKAVAAIDADIIALNEVDRKTNRTGKVDQVAKIANSLGMYYTFGKAIDFDGGQYGIAILSKYKIKHSEVLRLPSGTEEQRVLLASEIEVPHFDSPVVFMSTHLDFHQDDTLRTQQARRINEVISEQVDFNKIKDLSSKITILAGDFNDTHNSPIIADLSRYWNLVSSSDVNDMRSWPASNPLADIDHIFTGRGQVWQVQQIDVLQGKDLGIDWAKTSDHVPVVTKLRLLEQ